MDNVVKMVKSQRQLTAMMQSVPSEMFAGVRNKSLTCEKLLIIVWYWFECCYCVTIILVRKNDDGYNNCYVICITWNTRHSQSQLFKCTLPINCFKLRFKDFKDIKLVECALSMTSVCSANIMNFKEMVFLRKFYI